MKKEFDFKVEMILEKMWQLAAELYNYDTLYQREALEIQHLINICSSQPERLNPENCDHSGINIMQHLCSTSKRCSKCGSIFTVCDSLNSMVT